MRDEEWRRTDVRSLKLGSFGPPRRETPRRPRIARPSRRPGTPSRPTMPPAWSTSTPPPTRSADPSKLGGAVLVNLATAAKDHPEILERFLLTDAVSPTADAFSALHSAFWTGGTLALRPQGGQGRGPAVQPGRAGERGDGRPRPHARRPGRRGRGDPRPRDRRVGPGRRRRHSTCGVGRGLRRRRGEAPVRQPPELGRSDLALQPRARPRRRRRLDPVDRRRPRLPALEGQSGGRARPARGPTPRSTA